VPAERNLVGVIGRPHGVRGLVRVHSYTAEPADLPAYGRLTDDKGRQFVLSWRGEGVAEIAELRDGAPIRVTDRDAAARLTNVRLYIRRAQLPPPEADEFYLADLIGLEAADETGPLGRVAAVHDYGAGASLEIERPNLPPLLVPFTRTAVPEVDIAGGRVTVNPPREIEAAPPREAAA
jgi:16S rRNA processing protein RimM